MLSGNNGVLQRATDAKTRSDEAQIKERIQLAYHSALTGGQGSYTKESLEEELEKEFGENNYNVDDSDNTNWILSAKGQDVTILAGKKGANPSGTLSEEQLRAKITNEAGNCMIDENGNIIPINVWNYVLNDTDNTAIIEGNYDSDDDYFYTAYSGNVIDGKLEYEIPVFIKANNKLYKVIKLVDNALSGLGLQSVNIPDNITELGYDCLSGNNLTSLIIPDSVISIGSYFISGNPLTELKLSDNLESIRECAFSGCSSLTEINIPSSVTTMGNMVFYNLPSSVTVNIPFKEDEIPRGWLDDRALGWDRSTNAQINYAE